ncbi:helix-turn-helix domain-containing protein [Chryseobacterium jejuense]|uniref:AraC-type DNA-binding protein n=1 Tax=Chryseobacterium jejuense TaxID=445960 RepID=A0A2X2X0M4_CHRJE|nr:helix-turn-helix domain-containing protein [Chryseobacterium jejuense]SDI16322.1 AraC-type DNA-binding protein [Chryseobacterium jejuense]SQB46546.1 DNA-binding transcriptional activator FeaR [Chryseobacterium jejuense]
MDFLKTIATISVFILFLLILFLLTLKSNKKLSNQLFAGYLFFTAVDASGIFISEPIISTYPNLEIFRWTLILFNIPLFYLYVLSLCYEDFRLKRKHLFHIIPFVIITLILVSRIYYTEGIEKKYLLQHHHETSEMIVFQYLIEIQYLMYTIVILMVLKKARNIYLENQSYSTNLVYKWLFQMTLLFMVVHYFATFKNILRYTDNHQLLIFINSFLEIIALIVTSWFVLKALKYPEFFRGVDTQLQLIHDFNNETLPKTKSENQQNPDENITIQLELLKKYMTEEKPYLDPALTVQNLAAQMNMPSRELSILINSNMNQHFFDFVNKYRIENAMELLTNHSKKDCTVLEILYQVGFNSKSSFNTAFKKHTALTPTEYRNTFYKTN